MLAMCRRRPVACYLVLSLLVLTWMYAWSGRSVLVVALCTAALLAFRLRPVNAERQLVAEEST